MIGKHSKKHHYLKKKIFTIIYMEDITDADYSHVKRFCKYFEIKHLGKYYDLYVQSDTSLLADVF